MRLLLDENISPSLSMHLWALGWDTTSIRDRGRLGAADVDVLRLAIDEGRIIVTANAADFTQLCECAARHPGLLIIVDAPRAEQLALIRAGLAHVENRADRAESCMANRIVSVAADFTCTDHVLP